MQVGTYVKLACNANVLRRYPPGVPDGERIGQNLRSYSIFCELDGLSELPPEICVFYLFLIFIAHEPFSFFVVAYFLVIFPLKIVLPFVLRVFRLPLYLQFLFRAFRLPFLLSHLSRLSSIRSCSFPTVSSTLCPIYNYAVGLVLTRSHPQCEVPCTSLIFKVALT